MVKQPELGQRIRKAKGDLSARKLALRVGSSHVAISNIIAGKSIPRKPMLDAICRALSLNPDTLEPITTSAWDEWGEIMSFMDHGWGSRCDIWFTKYESDLKRIPSKE